jgi:hypothetical protein
VLDYCLGHPDVCLTPGGACLNAVRVAQARLGRDGAAELPPPPHATSQAAASPHTAAAACAAAVVAAGAPPYPHFAAGRGQSPTLL